MEKGKGKREKATLLFSTSKEGSRELEHLVKQTLDPGLRRDDIKEYCEIIERQLSVFVR